jgi:hypothetical protein
MIWPSRTFKTRSANSKCDGGRGAGTATGSAVPGGLQPVSAELFGGQIDFAAREPIPVVRLVLDRSADKVAAADRAHEERDVHAVAGQLRLSAVEIESARGGLACFMQAAEQRVPFGGASDD